MIPTLLISIALSSAQAADKEYPQTPRAEIYSILVTESRRPATAPPRGEAVLDLAETAVSRMRKAQKILADAKVWSTGTERPKEHWAAIESRLDQLESIYKVSIFSALDALGIGLIRGRETAVNTDIQLKERELFARLDTPNGPKAALGLGPGNPLGLRPSKAPLSALRSLREQSEASLVKSEELFERALNQLKKSEPKKSMSWYLEDLVSEAHESLRRLAETGLNVAKAEQSVARKNGPCWNAISALEAYGGSDGKGAFTEPLRVKAIELSNEAKFRHVENEFRYAARVEEARTWDYMLDTFAAPL